jgi:hypothetical protein
VGRGSRCTAKGGYSAAVVDLVVVAGKDQRDVGLGSSNRRGRTESVGTGVTLGGGGSGDEERSGAGLHPPRSLPHPHGPPPPRRVSLSVYQIPRLQLSSGFSHLPRPPRSIFPSTRPLPSRTHLFRYSSRDLLSFLRLPPGSQTLSIVLLGPISRLCDFLYVRSILAGSSRQGEHNKSRGCGRLAGETKNETELTRLPGADYGIPPLGTQRA